MHPRRSRTRRSSGTAVISLDLPSTLTWRNGRNEVRYVPADEVEALQEAIEGYPLFIRLAEQYAGAVIQLTHREQKKNKAPRKRNP